MNNKLLYLITVFIWGSTWLAIEFQLGEVEIVVSLFYRFTIAALIMLGLCKYYKVSLKFSFKSHRYILLLALGNFSLNYMIFYSAQQYLSSAIISIAFSTLLIFNIINTRIFFNKPIVTRIYIGALMGLIGITIIFWNEIHLQANNSTIIKGLLLAFIGTLVASFGNMISVRNSAHNINIFAANTWGMFYGSVFLLIFILTQEYQFSFSFDYSYIASLLYLALFGSVIAFASYFTLLKNLGAERASYIIVLSPVISVLLSNIFEGFSLTLNMIIGFIVVIIGNIIVLTPISKIKFILSRMKILK